MSGEQDHNDHSWQLQAECYQRRDEVRAINKDLGYDMFYPETGKSEEGTKWAKKFCKTCPVIVKCYVAGKNEAGIWGGEKEATRKRQARRSGIFLSMLQTRVQELWPDENKPHTEESNLDPELNSFQSL